MGKRNGPVAPGVGNPGGVEIGLMCCPVLLMRPPCGTNASDSQKGWVGDNFSGAPSEPMMRSQLPLDARDTDRSVNRCYGPECRTSLSCLRHPLLLSTCHDVSL